MSSSEDLFTLPTSPDGGYLANPTGIAGLPREPVVARFNTEAARDAHLRAVARADRGLIARMMIETCRHAGMSTAKIADLAGVTPTTIRRWEQSTSVPRPAMSERLAQLRRQVLDASVARERAALGVSADGSTDLRVAA